MIWPGQRLINLHSKESFWSCPLYDVVAKAKSLDRASECWSLLYIFLGVVPSNFWVQLEHSLVGLLANPFFLRYSILLCRLHTDKFPKSVVIWGGPLWRVRITWVRGPTLAALRACIMHNKIVIYFTLYNTIHSGALSNARRAQRSIMGSKICFAMLSSRSIHEFPISDPYKFWWEIKSSLRTSVLSCLRMFLSFPGFELNKGIYNLYLTVYIGHPGYGQLTADKIGYLLTSATWPYRGLRCTLSQWWYVF